MTFRERKAERAARYRRFVEGWKLRPCISCNGTGRYDHIGSPPCSACDGTGKVRYRPPTPPTQETPARSAPRKITGMVVLTTATAGVDSAETQLKPE